ncbi:MAG: hypothetical protein A3F14_00875 [Gammaproteobacteria bacterium RIFCSPHIGHO2_12_FULL_43_28]|nr:MAG: hypothetical protein A3F14_00875 [Gammaproteobacteria bacterium RIFCSPHIGHO2_12_FULL_43_28]
MRRLNGFHLIELLITLFLISIISVFAIPRYTQHIVSAKRLEAANMLVKLSVAMEEYQLTHLTYKNATLQALKIPEYVAKNNYQLMIKTADDSEYLLLAMPINEQALRDTRCGQLSLDSVGRKSVTGVGGVDECW